MMPSGLRGSCQVRGACFLQPRTAGQTEARSNFQAAWAETTPEVAGHPSQTRSPPEPRQAAARTRAANIERSRSAGGSPRASFFADREILGTGYKRDWQAHAGQRQTLPVLPNAETRLAG